MRKILIALYGIAAYVIGMVSSVYTIGFVGNFIVPKTIDSGTTQSTGSALAVNLILLSVFAIQHSGMARKVTKKWIVRYLHPSIERSTYVLLSGLVFALIFWLWQPMTAVVWNITSSVGIYIAYGLFGLGWIIAMSSTFMINHAELFGLQQVYVHIKTKSVQSSSFQIKYLYKFMRHPLMLGFIIAFWATPTMSLGHLLFAVVMTLYIFISVKYLEEKDLRESIGAPYEKYQESVPMLIPFTKNNKGSVEQES